MTIKDLNLYVRRHQYFKLSNTEAKIELGGGVLACKKVGRGRRKICNLFRRPIWVCLDLFVLSETKIRDLCH